MARTRTPSPDTAGGATIRTLSSTKRRSDVSRQVEYSDSFIESAVAGAILEPPYHPNRLSLLFEKSNILHQCVDAMVTNIAKMGYRAVPAVKDKEMDPDEKAILESFIEAPNLEQSLVGMNAMQVNDYETFGYAYLEVIRNAKGDPSLLKHAHASTVRILRRDTSEVTVKTVVLRGGRRSVIKERKRFRRYVQIVGGRKVYYKEFGDTRKMDYRTGYYESADHLVEKGNEATEILHRKQYSGDPYGVPRWIAQLPSILGSREAEEVNLRYFEDNTVPPMILSVSGGKLTQQSFSDLNKLLKQEGVGRDRQNQIMLIEAIPESVGLDDKGTVSIRVDKLVDQRPSDGLFKEYDDANINKVRSSFRLPPVTIGMSQDVNFATAQVSAFLAESQVFSPERAGHDEFLNKGFVNHARGLNLKTVKLESKGPAVTNPDQIVKTLTAINPMGGVTPRTAIDIVNETMQLSLPQYPVSGEEGWEAWMDKPMVLSQRDAKAQQTGEGDNTHDGQAGKDQDIKDREMDGETMPEPVEHGQE